MNFVAKFCQPPGILGDFAVDRWKLIDFTRSGILRPSPCTDKKWNSPFLSHKVSKHKTFKNPCIPSLPAHHKFPCDGISPCFFDYINTKFGIYHTITLNYIKILKFLETLFFRIYTPERFLGDRFGV